jgi:hypothetical protein
MKNLAICLITILTVTGAVFAAAPGGTPVIKAASALSDCSGSDGYNKKREETNNGVQVKLEICGSDLDNWEIDAVNPTGKAYDCSISFSLKGIHPSEEGKSVEISRSRSITVSSTASGWYNADSESVYREGKKFQITSLSVSCSEKK